MSNRRDAVAPNYDSPFLTVRAVADHLGVSERSVRQWIADGRLEHVRLGDAPGGRIRFSWRMVDAFLGRPAPEAAAPAGVGNTIRPSEERPAPERPVARLTSVYREAEAGPPSDVYARAAGLRGGITPPEAA